MSFLPFSGHDKAPRQGRGAPRGTTLLRRNDRRASSMLLYGGAPARLQGSLVLSPRCSGGNRRLLAPGHLPPIREPLWRGAKRAVSVNATHLYLRPIVSKRRPIALDTYTLLQALVLNADARPGGTHGQFDRGGIWARNPRFEGKSHDRSRGLPRQRRSRQGCRALRRLDGHPRGT